ncbi:MAG: type II secretion system inner membrane protein GspF [Deltaproteobacteria bacterium]|nr:type II secretion system inner membrane protein GspF [Deltaproteobacteria bacterium]
MPLFEYKGFSAKGKAVSGVVEADGAGDLRQKLLKDGVYLTQFGEAGARAAKAARPGKGGGASAGNGAAPGGGFLSREIDFRKAFERVRRQDVAVMTRQFATLLRAGVPMAEALTALSEQQERPKLRLIATTVREKVREGTSLADALAEHPAVFEDLYINMVRVGEASGTLDIVLERLADFLDSAVRLKSKVTSAMIYPVLMVCVAFLIVSLLMIFVIPRITELFADMGGELPFLTRVLIFTSDAFRNTWYIALPLGYFGVRQFRKYVRTEKGRQWWDRKKLRAPIFGPVFRLVAVARFSRTFATLLTSGVPVLSALEIVRAIVNNVVLGKAIEDAKVAVREGDSLAGPLQRSGEFPPMMTHMIAIGEKTGQLESMLGNVADAYDQEVENRVTMMTAILEPVMIVGMGVMVAFLVFAILQPMLKMNEVITGQ